MWKDFEGRARSLAESEAYLATLQWTDWKPVGITLHNTAAPTLAQWAESGEKHDARIRNLQSYYENERGWHAGPHWFISREWINWFSNPLLPGVHSRCFNATRFGIEMVGDFGSEAFDSGDGAKVRDLTIEWIARLNIRFHFDPDDLTFHVECTKDNHDCPGRNVVKSDVIARVKAKMAELIAVMPADKPAPPPEIDDRRLRMAAQILAFEARRDRNGNLAVYPLPAGDGGGSYEIAGINERYHPKEAAELRDLIQAGRYAVAEQRAEEIIASYTDVAATMFGSPWRHDPGVEFYLRDMTFNRGPTGAVKILQRAVGTAEDGIVGPKTRAAAAQFDPDDLLDAMREARESYERSPVGRDENSIFWRGLVNRWNNALKAARLFAEEAPDQPEPEEPDEDDTDVVSPSDNPEVAACMAELVPKITNVIRETLEHHMTAQVPSTVASTKDDIGRLLGLAEQIMRGAKKRQEEEARQNPQPEQPQGPIMGPIDALLGGKTMGWKTISGFLGMLGTIVYGDQLGIEQWGQLFDALIMGFGSLLGVGAIAKVQRRQKAAEEAVALAKRGVDLSGQMVDMLKKMQPPE